MDVNMLSLDAGLSITGLKEDQYEFFLSDIPATRIPEFKICDEIQKTKLKITDGSPKFTFTKRNSVYEYRFNKSEPTKNILWMAMPILERIHQNLGRFTVHSSAFAKAEEGILVVGESHSGKSTILLEAILNHGYKGIGGEHNLIALNLIQGGTKTIEFYSGVANTIPSLKNLLGSTPLGWEKANRLRFPLSTLSSAKNSAKLSLVVFPIITENPKPQIIVWSERKKTIELYKKMSEFIHSSNSFLFDNTCGFPSLDNRKLSELRMETAANIARNCSFKVIKGSKDSIINIINSEI